MTGTQSVNSIAANIDYKCVTNNTDNKVFIECCIMHPVNV